MFVLDHENQKVFHTVSFMRLNYEVDLEEQDALALCLSKLFRCLRWELKAAQDIGCNSSVACFTISTALSAYQGFQRIYCAARIMQAALFKMMPRALKKLSFILIL